MCVTEFLAINFLIVLLFYFINWKNIIKLL